MDEPLVLHSSRTRWGVSAATPVVLVGLGAYSLGGGVATGPVVLVVVGLVLAVVVLLDLPHRTEFHDDGILRVCVLRQQLLPWDRVVALERLASGARQRRALRRSTRDGPEVRGPVRSQGLTARLGPRRVSLLVDRRESHAEHAELRRIATAHDVLLRAAPPPIDAAPAGRGPAALHVRR